MATLKGDGKAIFAIFIGAIIAIAFIVAIANQTTGDTSIITITNDTVTAPAVNSSLELTGRELLTSSPVRNSTATCSGCILESTIGEDGLLSVHLRLNDTAASFAGKSVNVSYTAEPDGYINGSGARSISLLTLTIAAIAVLVFVIVVLFSGGSLANMIRRFK